MKITYYSETDKDYQAGLDRAIGIGSQQFFVFLNEWQEFVPDAIMQATAQEFNWQEFLDGFKKERRGHSSGKQWQMRYGAIILPEILLRVTVLAHQFVVPWGLAFHRAKDAGILRKRKGIYEWVKPEKDNEK